MGFFSFLTTDTKVSIPNNNSEYLFPVIMVDNNGNRWEETNYNGYGVFGDKDIYQLIAEMNNVATGDLDTDREIGIHLHFGYHGIINIATKQIILGGNFHFFNWGEPLKMGKSPNELIKEGTFKNINVKFPDAIFPNLFQNINEIDWKNKPLKDCPYQGHFY